MAGRTPGDAFERYVERLRESLHCVTPVRLTLRERGTLRVDVPYSVALNEMRPVRLQANPPIYLVAGQVARVRPVDDPRGPFKVRTDSYFYAIHVAGSVNGATAEALAFQWTPDATGVSEVGFPHLHIGAVLVAGQTALRPGSLHKAHIPTGRVSVEAVIRLAIREFGAKPLVSNWEEVLDRNEEESVRWKTR